MEWRDLGTYRQAQWFRTVLNTRLPGFTQDATTFHVRNGKLTAKGRDAWTIYTRVDYTGVDSKGAALEKIESLTVSKFRNRMRERELLEEWWDDPTALPLNMYGRRRVGKSWLFRSFAHGKPGVILVADELAREELLRRFSRQVAPLFGGVPPVIETLAELFRVIHRAAVDEKILVVIDEFQWLLPTKAADRRAQLSSVQAAWEDERDHSKLKLILCGSAVTQMRALQEEKNPLHGRLRPLRIQPLDWPSSKHFLESGSARADAFERFSLSGGFPAYLSYLNEDIPLADVLSRSFLAHTGALFDEGRHVVASEFNEPAVHFSIIQQVADRPKGVKDIGDAIGKTPKELTVYLDRLRSVGLLEREVPYGAPGKSRDGQWTLNDSFLRFWFRFVMPNQAEIEDGLDPGVLYREGVARELPSHVGAVFEDECRRYIRRQGLPGVTRTGRWWGNALNKYRMDGLRTSEEIDVVAGHAGKVAVVGEAKWQKRQVGVDVLTDLRQFKIPALRQYLGSHKNVPDNVTIYIFSKSGFTAALERDAAADASVTLVTAEDVLAG